MTAGTVGRFLRFLILGAALAPVFATARAQGLVDPANPNDNLRDQLALTRLVNRNDALSPCDSFATKAFSELRPSGVGMWAGEFEVMAVAPGDWFVVVEGGRNRWRQKISTKDERWLTPAFFGPFVEMFLEGPGTGGACPQVILRSELRGGIEAMPRGVVGADQRWHPDSPELRTLPDAATIESWAPSIVHLQIFDAQRGLPCTGFFVTAHLVMTARHCVMTPLEAVNTVLELGANTIQGVLLLVSQADLDFSLLWVNIDTSPAPLVMRAEPAAPMVLWQSPASREVLVSVVDCAVAAGAGRFFHKCDTSVGTSGAPIQNRANGSVVAVHTDGCVISGQPQCVNIGTAIADILARLTDRLPLLDQAHPMAAAELRSTLK